MQVALRTLLEERDRQRADDERDARGDSVDPIGIEDPPRVAQPEFLPAENSFADECGDECERRAVMQEGEEGGLVDYSTDGMTTMKWLPSLLPRPSSSRERQEWAVEAPVIVMYRPAVPDPNQLVGSEKTGRCYMRAVG